MAADLQAVVQLERADRLEDAAELAERLALHAEAARLWERACQFGRAARSAIAAGDGSRAVELASRAHDPEAESASIALLATQDRELGLRLAARLSDGGRARIAGRVRLALGDPKGAATDFERAGALGEAARAHQRAGDPRSAARCYEAALAADGSAHDVRVELGTLLERHGKLEAAVRVLQQVPRTAAERAPCLPLLARALHGLGMADAAGEIEREMVDHGVAAQPARRDAPAPAPEGEERILFGRYRVVADVARTPTARVYRCVDRITETPVAVKLFAAAALRDAGRDALARFEREAVVLGRLHHPAIMPLHAFVPEGPAVVLPWMGGGSLADLLATRTLGPARAVEVACAVLGALGEAHRRGILHRDIKPANVLFDEAGAAYLADFGTAHVADAAATVTSGVIGTLAYMAPEQRAGRPANPKSDVYGVGALLWHALTGAPPDARLPFLSRELEPRHEAVIRALIAPEADRPESTTLARDLLASLDWPKTEPPPRPRTTEPSRAAADGTPRLQALGGVRHRDRLLGREIYVLDAEPGTLARALAFARADSPSLAPVLALDPVRNALWIDAVAGPPLARGLTGAERSRLRDALEALHRAGGVHGAVDAEHAIERGGEIVLRFALEPPEATPADDLAALEALGRGERGDDAPRERST